MEEEVWDQNEGAVDEGWEKEEKQEDEPIEEGNWNKEDFVEESVPVDTTMYDQTSTYDQPHATYDQTQFLSQFKQTKEWERPPDSILSNREGVTPPRADLTGDLEYSGRVSRRGLHNQAEREDYHVGLRRPVIGEVMTSNVGFGQSLKRMVREAWGAAKPEGRATLRSPIGKVRFTQTGTQYCSTTEECMQQCRAIQTYYMDLGFPDIPYNFLIGGDGVVYHARGWAKQADRSPAFHKLKKTTVDVAYIGDFLETKIPYEMLSAAADFLKYGLKVSRLTPFFQSFTYLSDIKRS